MGRAISLSAAFFAGARVAGQLTYIPQHLKNGKKISARCVIPVYCNSHRGHDQKTGAEGKSDAFKFVAWGKLADVCCRSLPPGKAIDVDTKPGSYLGKLFNQNGTLRTDNAGMPIEIPKVAFTIKDIVFGEESAKIVAEEIAAGRRPMNWDKANHPDFQMWIQILTQRQAMVWDGRSPEFMYARVVVPQGPGIQLDFTQNPQQNLYGQNTAVNMPNAVANAFGAKFDSMTGQPIPMPVQPLAKFDAITGKPFNQPVPVSYDPQTGIPIYASREEMLRAAPGGFPVSASVTPPASGYMPPAGASNVRF
jgi:hypothetical protein